VASPLQLPATDKKELEGASAGRRMKAIGEAVAWPKGQSPQKQIDQTVYSRSGFDVRLGKPGKETLRVGAARKPEDMLPKMFALGTMIPMPASFEDIIERLETDCAEDELSHVGAARGRLLS